MFVDRMMRAILRSGSMGGCRDRASSSRRRRKRNALDVQCPRPREEEKISVLLVTEKGRRLNSIIARAAADDDGKEEE